MAESLILPNSTFSANNITATGNVVISSALYLGTTSLQVSASTGGVNANVYSAGSLVRQGCAPTYVESSSAPSVAAEGDKWWSTSNSLPFRYLSGGWRKLVPVVVESVNLYNFTSATFTPGGATGQNGPIISQARSRLSGTPDPSNWNTNTSFFNMSTQGIQLWTVPATGTYTITAAGARGGNANGMRGGNGRVVQATFSLTKAQVIKIVVGQGGNTIYYSGNPFWGGSGGGGTFVTDNSNNILLIAGGGGGAKQNQAHNSYVNGYDAPFANYGLTQTGAAGASGGNGGGVIDACSGGGGGGYSGNGQVTSGCYIPTVAYSFLNGAVGGTFTSGGYASGTAYGGFGGGGSCVNDNACRPGGGGGYSGGGGADYDGTKGAGGAGYYSSGTSTTNIGVNPDIGYVMITKSGGTGTLFLFPSTGVQSVPAGTYNYFLMGGGGSGGGSHTGGGGAGYIATGTFTYAGGNLSVTVGNGGTINGPPNNGADGVTGGATVINTGGNPTASGGQGVAVNMTAGNGSSGGGGLGNSGYGGAGGSGGSNGVSGQANSGGTGQGNTLVTNAMTLLQTGLRTIYTSATVTAGSGGAAGTSSHSGGGGGGGISIASVTGLTTPTAENGAFSTSAGGGVGFGAGGGSGGCCPYYGGGQGARGLAVIWQ